MSDYENTEAMKALRGPLSRRATSAEFNEWMARDVVEYVDRLRAEKAELVEALRLVSISRELHEDRYAREVLRRPVEIADAALSRARETEKSS